MVIYMVNIMVIRLVMICIMLDVNEYEWDMNGICYSFLMMSIYNMVKSG